MKRTANASLKHLNSFAVDATAGQLFEFRSTGELDKFIQEHGFDPNRDLILGGGSNILFADDVEGTVLVNRLMGKSIVNDCHDSSTDTEVLIDVHAGEVWHTLVMWTLDQGLYGLENLSLIPGLAGAAPMQNIGAYGVELSDVLDSVEVFEIESGAIRELSLPDCRLSYRDSRFKSVDAGKYLITRVRLRLNRVPRTNLNYSGLRDELTAMGIAHDALPTAVQVSNAVIRLRQRKLPDPEIQPNAGSFFKNPIVSHSKATEMAQEYPLIPVYTLSDKQSKLSAAWMIEHCGWKGHSMGRAAVSSQHALVLINRGGASGKEILELARLIHKSVFDRFGIDLQTEPLIVGADV